MKQTYITFDSIKLCEESGLMFGCYCGSNEQMKDAVISLLGVSIMGQYITTLEHDIDGILYVGFGDDSKVSKNILYKQDFIIFHEKRNFIRMEEAEE
jgi:hypothetical protein